MAKLINFLLLILLILLGFYAYNFYLDLPLESRDLSIVFKQDLPPATNTSSTLVQFAPNMRFADSRLSYYLQSECTPSQIASVGEAFSILSERTQVLSFYRTASVWTDADIIIKCSEQSKELDSESENKRTFIAGEGGPTQFLELSPYSLIKQGEVQLFSSKYIAQCDEPLVEIHELLHVFGYDHITDKSSILYPYLDCKQELKENIVADLIKIYSEPAKAEVLVANVSASKAGAYLDFYIEIKNTGLIDATDISLDIFADNKLIKTYPIEKLSPGLLRSLALTNLGLPSSRVSSIRFVVKTPVLEYSTANNVVEMVVN